ncbi:auxin efflux carrier [Lentinus tigrinus ALCF2SS1-6]|uniref:Auxin efflux carrier n=1 Tax=Lentinus tigrinus ALCF2SS1-6 TaxID=1328759 RepID=A0A5C2SXK1_9APHY|nr:auxin efflux carrier [Lentinus tigrinus ALCF2SS1-6]
MPSAGYLIYSGIMPLIKTFITIIAGFVLSRLGLFPKAAARGASQVTMELALPALIFSSVVPAFTPENIKALGPLFLTAFTYQAIGFSFGYLIREICYVPRNFWQGIVVLTGMSNWGNLPNAVVLSITKQPPFNPDTDQALGVSYVSIFIVAYHIVFWMLGAAHSLSWDFRDGVPQGEAAERRVSWKEKPIGRFIATRILHEQVPDSFGLPKPTAEPKDEEAQSYRDEKDESLKVQDSDTMAVQELASQTPEHSDDINRESNPDPDVQLARRTSRVSTVPTPATHLAASAPSNAQGVPPVPPPTPALSLRNVDTQSIAQRSATLNTPTLPQKIVRVFRPLAAVCTPVTCTLAVALPIALIDPLKALFIDISATGGPHFTGPDGRPPLAFLIDTGSFIGGITIPLALILLGANFAQLKMPRPLSRLPIVAMILTTAVKMILLPVIGIFIVQAMTKSGFVDRKEITLRFVLMFLSGTPTAVNQLIVASLYAPDGQVNNLAAFLLVQYVFMFFSSSALTAVALLLL